MDSCALIMNWHKPCILFLSSISKQCRHRTVQQTGTCSISGAEVHPLKALIVKKRMYTFLPFLMKNTSYSKYT